MLIRLLVLLLSRLRSQTSGVAPQIEPFLALLYVGAQRRLRSVMEKEVGIDVWLDVPPSYQSYVSLSINARASLIKEHRHHKVQ